MSSKNWKLIFLYASISLFFIDSAFSLRESFAQKQYPEKAIKLIVGTQPGGLIDLGARAWSDDLSKKLGVPVLIQNQGGGGGTLALTDASKAKPDGYTLVAASQTPMVVSPTVTPGGLPYDSTKDFVPIGAFGITPTLIVVNSNSPFRTIEELLDYAKKNPGKLNCGSAGVGTISHFDLELVKTYGKVDIVHVPFKGSTPAVSALLGNHVDALIIALPALPGQIKAGRIRGLATTTKIKEFLDIPLFSDKGLREAGLATWAGFFAPAKISQDVHRKLAQTFEEVVKDQAVIRKLENVGFTSYYLSPEGLAKLLKEELVSVAEIAKKAGIKAE